MASGAVEALAAQGREPAGGLVASVDAATPPHSSLGSARGAHPVPDEWSHAAGAALAVAAHAAREAGSVIVLLSGGTTSLLAAPAAGVEAHALARLFELLHASGLPVAHANAIRKRFLRWGAGRLAAALLPAPVLCLALSDVPGDDIPTIGSGPCAPDPLTAADVDALLAPFGNAVPAGLLDYVARVRRGELAETPKPGAPAFARVETVVIASNRDACRAARARASALGLAPIAAATEEPLTGEASVAGVHVARVLLESRAESPTDAADRRLRVAVWGGETVVTRQRGTVAPHVGDGGRCQELALAAAGTLHDAGARGVTLLAAGTDGRDGPTDAAGAIVDELTWCAVRDAGRNPARDLAEHRSHHALRAAGALLRTGPSGTNVMDLVIGLVAPAPAF